MKYKSKIRKQAEGVGLAIDKLYRQRIQHLLEQIGEPGKCRGCGMDIYWVQHKNGKKAPYNLNGNNHFMDCPAAERFKRSTRNQEVSAVTQPAPSRHSAGETNENP